MQRHGCRDSAALIVLLLLAVFWPGARAAELQVASANSNLELVYRTVVLPRGTVGQSYEPRQIVRGGTPPYTIELADGVLPEGMSLSTEGRLSGTPGKVGNTRFILKITDAAVSPVSIEQRYSLGIDPVAARKPSAPASAPAESLPILADEPVQLTTFRLEAADLKELLEARTATAESPAEAEDPFTPAPPPRPKPAGPDEEQLTAMLSPLLDIDYPTRPLFDAALEAQHCNLYRGLLGQGELKPGTDPDACPGRDALVAGLSKSHGEAAKPTRTGNAAYTQLLPADLAAEVAMLAEKRFLPEQAPPVLWRGDDCGCVDSSPVNQVYGIYPFWQAQPEVQPIDFSQLTRITYAALSLTASGDYVRPAHWDDQSRDFIRRAHRYGTAVDLMIVRRDWQRLLRMNEREQQDFVERAAGNAVTLVDTPLNDAFARLAPYVLPFWDTRQYLYDGITVFFHDPQATDRAGFKALFQRFMRRLIERMQQSGRSYALNIVVPDELLGQPGAYDFSELLAYIELAEPPRSAPPPEGPAQPHRRGTTDIAVRFLVLISEPTALSQKLLRARLDDTDVLRGHGRIAVLDRTVPLLFHASGTTPVPLDAEHAERLDDDLTYINWQFGGVGFWPLPIRTLGTGQEVIQRLGHTYYPRDQLAPGEGLCRWICPNHVVLRLLLEALVITGAVSVVLYFCSWPVRRLGRTYVLYLWGGAVVTLLLALALLRCDPSTAALREGNSLLYALLAISVLAGAYVTLRPRIAVP